MQPVSLDMILRLGDPALYETSEPVHRDELDALHGVIGTLHALIIEYRRVHGAGRAIAAPQIGVKKRLICMNVGSPAILINPVLEDLSEELMEVWDDCMCFPGLLVRVMRHRSVKVRFRDENWVERRLFMEGDLSELLQHEYDHLDGILATMRAVDDRSFQMICPNTHEK